MTTTELLRGVHSIARSDFLGFEFFRLSDNCTFCGQFLGNYFLFNKSDAYKPGTAIYLEIDSRVWRFYIENASIKQELPTSR